MPDTYTVKKNDSLWSISKRLGISLPQLKSLNPSLKSRIPAYGINPGDVIQVPPAQQKGDLKKACEKCKDCVTYQLAEPFLIAKAVASNIFEKMKIDVNINDTVLHGDIMPLGQDITHSYNGEMVGDCFSISDDEGTLRTMILQLLDIFDSNDPNGIAKKLFNQFLKKNAELTFFTDNNLNKLIETSTNFAGYPDRTLGAPGTGGAELNKPRIHQHLKNAGWDINKVKLIEGLGVPAFNHGNRSFVPFRNQGDWANGLAVMINGVQYVYVYVEKYSYDSCKSQYEIELKFVLYDVFGLDDADLKTYGISNTATSIVMASQGITAWWQLQHQFNYAPVLTQATVYKSYKVSTYELPYFGITFP